MALQSYDALPVEQNAKRETGPYKQLANGVNSSN